MNATTPRPLISCSFAQLEAQFEAARRAGNGAVLRDLRNELQFRTNRQTAALAARVTDALNKLAGATISAPRERAQQEARPRASASGRTATRRQPPAPSRARGRRPTDEQQQALDAFKQEASLKVNAYAGAGKTSTLKLLAQSTSRCGQYIAYNKAIVADTRGDFPDTVNCATSHSLAYRAIAPRYGGVGPKLTSRINANELAQHYTLKPTAFGSDLTLQPRSLAFLMLDTVRRFSQSASEVMGVEHVPPHGALRTAPAAVLRSVQAHALAGANRLWAEMVDPRNTIPLGHDGYLKLWALSRPLIGADFILLDEAQDTNPVVLGVLADQEVHGAQMVYVGDTYQQIYEWRGAVNAMESIQTQAVVRLTQSFRFGDAIAALASKVLRQLDEREPVRGNPKVNSRIGEVDPDVVLARSNASTMSALIEALNDGLAPHLVGGVQELKTLLKGVLSLKDGQPCEVPDFFGFEHWGEVVEFARSEEGAHLLTFVNLVESMGERRLLWALGRTVDENRSNIVISTAHKSKGREWKSVKLLDDFMRSRPMVRSPEHPGPDPAELRLLYVALTRAKVALEIPESLLSLMGSK